MTKEEKNAEQVCKYRELLRGIQEKEKQLQEDKDMEMEITWVPGRRTPALQPQTTKVRNRGDQV